MQKQTTYLVTGSAGFIGFHTAKKMLERGARVIGIDNFNDYYDVSLKEARNGELEKFPNFTLYRGDIADIGFVKKVFSENVIDTVCHLAAQAGVRFSLKEPYRYIETNLVGFAHILNEAKDAGVKNVVLASSSSVYGNQDTMPFSESADTDHPLSLYAATKKADEVMAYSYHHLFGMNCTCLRFFTVYGPWGRPDMAIFNFTKSMLNGTPIDIFNQGDMHRDFTFVEDIAEGVVRACEKKHSFEIINLGSNAPVKLSYMVELLERETGVTAVKNFLPLQSGDVLTTYASIDKAKEKLGWMPQTTIEDGIKSFVAWYRDYYQK